MATKDSGGGQQHAQRRSEDAREVQDSAGEQGSADVQERHEKLSEDVDSLLDEIDDVLEENAEEFIKGYVQKGGQ